MGRGGRLSEQLNLLGRGGRSSDQLELLCGWGERGVDTAGRRSSSVVSLPRSHERTQTPLRPHASLLPPPAPRLDTATPAPASAVSEQNNGLSRVRTSGMGWARPQRTGDPSGRWGGGVGQWFASGVLYSHYPARAGIAMSAAIRRFSLPDQMILTTRSNDQCFDRV